MRLSRALLPGVPAIAAAFCSFSTPSAALADVSMAVPASTQSVPPPPPPEKHFAIYPVIDGAIIGTSVGVAGLMELVLQTGEIKPLGPTVDPGALLPIDRIAVTQTIDPHAGFYSDVGLYAAIGFTGLDSVLSGVRYGWSAGLMDAVMYLESVAVTLTVTDLTKIAVRRPRPIDYKDQSTANVGTTTNTDETLSFFSGHAGTLAAITGTSTYLAFVRSPHSARPWVTLAAGTLLTAFVDYERVRAGAHFPTDVIAGTLTGAAIGVVVPRLHHLAVLPVWVSAAPTMRGYGATLFAQGSF